MDRRRIFDQNWTFYLRNSKHRRLNSRNKKNFRSKISSLAYEQLYKKYPTCLVQLLDVKDNARHDCNVANNKINSHTENEVIEMATQSFDSKSGVHNIVFEKKIENSIIDEGDSIDYLEMITNVLESENNDLKSENKSNIRRSERQRNPVLYNEDLLCCNSVSAISDPPVKKRKLTDTSAKGKVSQNCCENEILHNTSEIKNSSDNEITNNVITSVMTQNGSFTCENLITIKAPKNYKKTTVVIKPPKSLFSPIIPILITVDLNDPNFIEILKNNFSKQGQQVSQNEINIAVASISTPSNLIIEAPKVTRNVGNKNRKKKKSEIAKYVETFADDHSNFISGNPNEGAISSDQNIQESQNISQNIGISTTTENANIIESTQIYVNNYDGTWTLQNQDNTNTSLLNEDFISSQNQSEVFLNNLTNTTPFDNLIEFIDPITNNNPILLNSSPREITSTSDFNNMLLNETETSPPPSTFIKNHYEKSFILKNYSDSKFRGYQINQITNNALISTQQAHINSIPQNPYDMRDIVALDLSQKSTKVSVAGNRSEVKEQTFPKKRKLTFDDDKDDANGSLAINEPVVKGQDMPLLDAVNETTSQINENNIQSLGPSESSIIVENNLNASNVNFSLCNANSNLEEELNDFMKCITSEFIKTTDFNSIKNNELKNDEDDPDLLKLFPTPAHAIEYPEDDINNEIKITNKYANIDGSAKVLYNTNSSGITRKVDKTAKNLNLANKAKHINNYKIPKKTTGTNENNETQTSSPVNNLQNEEPANVRNFQNNGKSETVKQLKCWPNNPTNIIKMNCNTIQSTLELPEILPNKIDCQTMRKTIFGIFGYPCFDFLVNQPCRKKLCRYKHQIMSFDVIKPKLLKLNDECMLQVINLMPYPLNYPYIDEILQLCIETNKLECLKHMYNTFQSYKEFQRMIRPIFNGMVTVGLSKMEAISYIISNVKKTNYYPFIVDIIVDNNPLLFLNDLLKYAYSKEQFSIESVNKLATHFKHNQNNRDLLRVILVMAHTIPIEIVTEKFNDDLRSALEYHKAICNDNVPTTITLCDQQPIIRTIHQDKVTVEKNEELEDPRTISKINNIEI